MAQEFAIILIGISYLLSDKVVYCTIFAGLQSYKKNECVETY